MENKNFLNKQILEKLVSEVWETVDKDKRKIISPDNLDKLKQYEIVVAFPTVKKHPKNDYIGFPVQIRKNCGVFGSDLVLIRDFEDNLSTWENQGFILLNQKELDIVNPIFEDLIKEEKTFTDGYSIKNKNTKIGFIV